jgi:hypothetical protein
LARIRHKRQDGAERGEQQLSLGEKGLHGGL